MDSVRSFARKSSRDLGRSSTDVSSGSKIDLFQHEETDFTIIYSIREELIDKVLDECMENDFKRSTISYMVRCAYEAIKRIIELEFNMHDFGKDDFVNDPIWVPDQPPKCSPPDTWAASNVPVVTTLDEEDEAESKDAEDIPRTFSISGASFKDQKTDQSFDVTLSAPMSLTSVVEQYLVAPNTSEIELEEYLEDEEKACVKKEKSVFTTLMTCSADSNPFTQYSSNIKWKDGDKGQKTPKTPKSLKSTKSLGGGSTADKRISKMQAESKISINSLPPLRAEAQLKIMGSFTKEPSKADTSKNE